MKRSPFHRNEGSDFLPTSLSIPPENARTIIYCRVSTESQAADDRASMPVQKQNCQEFAEKRGRAVDHVWTDPGVSGRDEERCERLVSWAEAHPRRGTEHGLIIVQDASRWGRFTGRPHASGFYRHRLSRAGWDMEFALQPSTGNRTTDGVVAVLHDAQAADESEEKGRRAQIGTIGQAKLGRWLGRPPFGFDRVAISDSGKERPLAPYEWAAGSKLAAGGRRVAGSEYVKLVPGSDADVRTVRRIFEWFAEGQGVEEIAKRLNKQKVPGPWVRYPCGTDQWSGFNQINHILRCDAYIGRRRLRPHILDFEPRGGKRREFMHPDHWVVVENAYDAIVDRDVWDKVQARLTLPHRSRATGTRYLLAGLLRCRCGALFKGGGGSRRFVVAREEGTHVQVGGKRSGEFRRAKAGEPGQRYVEVKDPEHYQFYKCPMCREPRRVTVNKRWIEGCVIKLVSQHVRGVLKDGKFDEVLDEVMAEQSGQRRKGRKDIETERAQLKQELNRLVQAVAAGSLRSEEIKPLANALRTSLEELEHDRQRGKFEERGAMLSPKERARLKAMARDFPARIKNADIVTAQELMAAWISEIVIDAKNPRRRTGRLVLRVVPIEGFSNSTPGS